MFSFFIKMQNHSHHSPFGITHIMTPARMELFHQEIQQFSASFHERQALHKELQHTLKAITHEMKKTYETVTKNKANQKPIDEKSNSEGDQLSEKSTALRLAQQHNVRCPAELAQLLCREGARVFKDQSQLEIALANLAPAELRRHSADFFQDLLPIISLWLNVPHYAAQAFALLHEGLCLYPECGVLCRKNGKYSDIEAAVGSIMNDAILLERLAVQGRVKKSDISRLQQFLST